MLQFIDIHINEHRATRATAHQQLVLQRYDVWALIDKTLTHHERAYDHLPIDEQLTTQVRLTFNDGSTRAAKVVHPRGTGDRNLTNADIRDKYAKLTHRAISAERQAAIEKPSSASTLPTTSLS